MVTVAKVLPNGPGMKWLNSKGIFFWAYGRAGKIFKPITKLPVLGAIVAHLERRRAVGEPSLSKLGCILSGATSGFAARCAERLRLSDAASH